MTKSMSLALLALTLAAAGTARASILDVDWSTYTNGTIPTSPWSIAQAAGDAVDGDSVTVQNGWLHYSNQGTGTNNWNPEIKYSFAQNTTSNLNIHLSYKMPDNGSGSQFVFALRNSSNVTAVYLVLGHNWYYQAGMSYKDSAGNAVPIGHTFVANETVDIWLNNINLTTSTFDINWSSSTGASGSKAATFQNAVTNFSNIFLSDNTGPDTKSIVDLGNMTIDAVPEPASLSLVALVGAGFLLRRRK